MATKSIYKNINVKDKGLGHALVLALQNTQKTKTKDVCITRTFSEPPKEKIKDIFNCM